MLISKHVRHLLLILCACGMLLGSGLAAAAVDVQVDGNRVVANIALPGAIGAELILEFDQAIGLSTDSIGIDAQLADLTDVNLLARLPSTLTSIPAAFPVLITIEPPADEGLSFTGAAKVEIHTHNLTLVTDTPLRLFKAQLAGPFSDITESIGAGSVRSRGRTGGFSQFLIIADLRSHEEVAALKFDGLELRLDDPALSTALADSLSASLAAARSDFDSGDVLDAIDHVEDFLSEVQANADALPHVWRASRDLDNLAGELIARASSLRFTLRMANSLL